MSEAARARGPAASFGHGTGPTDPPRLAGEIVALPGRTPDAGEMAGA